MAKLVKGKFCVNEHPQGKKELNSAILDSHNDEAIAMALAVAGLKANDETNIRKSQCIDMVYPEFLEQLRKI